MSRDLPHDPEGMNHRRALWAASAVECFGNDTGQDASVDGPFELMSDLVADLHHLADRARLDWDDILAVASSHYRDETAAID